MATYSIQPFMRKPEIQFNERGQICSVILDNYYFCCLRKFGHSVSSLALHIHVAALLGLYFQFFSEWINLVLVWHCQKHIFVVNGKHCSHRYRKKALYEVVSLKKGLQCFPLTSLPAALCMQTDSVPEKPWGVL